MGWGDTFTRRPRYRPRTPADIEGSAPLEPRISFDGASAGRCGSGASSSYPPRDGRCRAGGHRKTKLAIGGGGPAPPTLSQKGGMGFPLREETFKSADRCCLATHPTVVQLLQRDKTRRPKRIPRFHPTLTRLCEGEGGTMQYHRRGVHALEGLAGAGVQSMDAQRPGRQA